MTAPKSRRKPRIIAGQTIMPGVGPLAKKRTDTPGQGRGAPEFEAQAALIRWVNLWRAKGNPHRIEALSCLFAVPNGGYYLSPAAAGKLKAAGLLAGTWDLFMPRRAIKLSTAGYWVTWCGLFVEMKSATGRLSPEQKAFREQLEGQYQFAVCRTWHEAARAILSYLAVPRTHPAWSGLEEK